MKTWSDDYVSLFLIVIIMKSRIDYSRVVMVTDEKSQY